MAEPFILLDDARPEGASDARLYRAPVELVVARRPEEVAPALARIEALHAEGRELAGYLAYEAGLALEPRLASLAAGRTGAMGPLVWFGAFENYETISAAQVPQWLAANAGGPSGSIGPLEPQLSFGGYGRNFAALQEAIRAGDIYQANLTFPLAASWRGDPLALYTAIRPSAGAGYGGVVFDGTHWLLSFSPELFFALKDGAATVKPMKGTRPRGRTPGEDKTLADELAASVKDRAENLMIVDLMRNDLSRVAEPGSVRVENAFAVESYPTVHQMVSTVRARLQPGKGAVDMIRALFPCGSITGAPKIRAMELIQQTERDARGAYCGAIGRIDPSGDAAFNVAIRTLRLTPGENGRGRAVLGVGSAIVADSDALDEWRECLVKGGFVRESPASFDLIETMAFTPDGGIPLLELHLERIKASASELGFLFDRHAVRNAIQALCFDADRPGKLRLVLARSGSYSLELADLPADLPDPAPCAVFRLPVDPGDWRLRHKNSDRGFYEAGLAAAQAEGGVEGLFLRSDGLVTEGCFTNVFVERDGKLLTPPLALGLLPGVLRRALIEEGRAEEAELTLADLGQGFFIGNALRGLMPARLLP
ncbi:aminodeoxychorismate synthase component I [Novosphingobium sp. G106]|uniref:aminodeoxychorismate synthase component I n=1 Tax=Novosphingobium sp. G106 TaxID=2849500 RepID=UPI001C2D8C09|nr:aminodeoxychorismate synthase component I [Novosphingobium sp. G106]MBV1689900.1 aminodeoxychorismate synthase component I [Novosphingobium sp. G106]